MAATKREELREEKGHNSHFPPTQFLPESPSQETGRPFSSSDYTAWNIITASLLLLLLLLFWQRREKMMNDDDEEDEEEEDWNIKKSSAPHAFREKRGVTDFREISTPLPSSESRTSLRTLALVFGPYLYLPTRLSCWPSSIITPPLSCDSADR